MTGLSSEEALAWLEAERASVHAAADSPHAPRVEDLVRDHDL
jgi:hypothetical protein